MSNGFFSVDAATLRQLDDERSVLLLHKILHAEARRLGLDPSLISVPFDINDADGGIDAQISGAPTLGASHVIFVGKTYYQVKSGQISFNKSGLQDVVCVKKVKGQSERHLKPRIKQIAEENGTFVLFLTGESAPDIDVTISDLMGIIKEEVPNTALTVKLVQIDNIDAILEPFLSIRLSLLGRSGFQGMVFDEWATMPIMDTYFQKDEERDKQIANIQSLAESFDPSDRMIRVSGFPGNGKTRSVLEALKPTHLASLVIYFQKPSDAVDTGNLLEIGLRNDIEAIVVIDECDALSLTQATNIIGSAKSKVKLITIFNEDGGAVGATKYVDLNDRQRLSQESIEKIITHYGIPQDVASRWSEFCDGSPRAAHMIAENLIRNPDDLLKNPSYDLAMERYLANSADLNGQEFKDRREVISWLSLFKRFGWSKDFTEERKFILHKIIQITGLPEGRIEEVINELKSRKILQGDKTLYISPRLLHIRAWVWWWEKYKSTFDYEEFQKTTLPDGTVIQLDGQLRGWFTEMFEYAKEAEGASEVVRQLLSPDGPLRDEQQLMEAFDSNFFLSLTKADPEHALMLLQRWFDTKTDEELATLQDGRQNLVWSLEAIAVWKDSFVGAARLLLRLARTESNHRYSNNSEGTFAGLFSNGWGQLAPSEAGPSEKISVLKEAVESDNPKEVLLGLNAIEQALESDNFSRISGAEIQGLREGPKLWTPKTWGELFDAFKMAWGLLIAILPSLNDEQRQRAITIISNQLRGLLRLQEPSPYFMQTYHELITKGLIPTEEAISTVGLILKYEQNNLAKEVFAELKDIFEMLEGDDFDSRLKRFVATNINDDWWGDDGRTSDSQLKLEELAKAVIADESLLASSEWLYTQEAKNGFRFGKVLADHDTDFKLLKNILDGQRKAFEDAQQPSIFFTSGYLFGLHNANIEKWHKVIDQLVSDEQFRNKVTEIIWRNGLDDVTGAKILTLLNDGHASANDLAMFRMGGEVKKLSEPLFTQWVEFLLNEPEITAHITAIDLVASYYVFQETKELPKELTKQVLTKETLVKSGNRQFARDIDYDWSLIAKRWMEQNPDDTEFLIDFILENYGHRETIFENHYQETTNVLNELTRLNPSYTWNKLTSLIREDAKSAFELGHWLGGGGFGAKSGAITLFDRNKVMDWIDEDPKERAVFVAHNVPHDFGFNSQDNSSWLSLVLDKYGDNKDVRGAINSNLWSEGYSGPASLHYSAKLEDIRRFKQLHKDSKNIQTWADEFMPSIEAWVADAKKREERGGF